MDSPQVDGALWVSITELAAIKKKSKQGISKRVKRLQDSGAITVKEDGQKILVNLVEYNRAIGEHTDPAQALRNAGLDIDGVSAPAASAPASQPKPDADDASPVKSRGYLLHKETSAAYQAENDRLDLEERLLRFVDKKDAEHRTFNIFRQLRDRLLQVPAICAPRVAHLDDERAVKAVIDEELRKVLAALAAKLDAADSEDDEDDTGLIEDEGGEDQQGAAQLQ